MIKYQINIKLYMILMDQIIFMCLISKYKKQNYKKKKKKKKKHNKL